VIVSDNHISDCAFSAVRINTGKNCQIRGNVCLGSGETGIYSYPGEYQLKWRGSGSVTYAQGGWDGTLSIRYSGSGLRDIQWKSGVDIDRNKTPAVAYADLQLSKSFSLGGVDARVDFTVNNLLDKDPPMIGTDASDTVGFGTNSEYDLVGRAFRLGVNIKY